MQVSNWNAWLDVKALGDHDSTRRQLQGRRFSIGQGHGYGLVVSIRFAQTSRTKWMSSTRIDKTLMTTRLDLTDLEDLQFQLV